MRKIFLTFAPVIGTLALCGCNKDDNNLPPGSETAETMFKAKYPEATATEWEKKGDYWVVDFRQNTKASEAWFGQTGEWYLTETDVLYDALPETVKTAFSTGEYQSWHIDDIDIIERLGMDSVYVLEVEQGKDEYDLYYSPDGTLLKAVADSHDNDDNGKYLPSTLSDRAKTYIAANYTEAKILEIEQERDMIEVDILDGATHRELLFDANGEWVRTETEIKRTAVPQNIMDALSASAYASYKIDDVSYYETPQRNYYRFELESASQDVELNITLEGVVEVVKVEKD